MKKMLQALALVSIFVMALVIGTTDTKASGLEKATWLWNPWMLIDQSDEVIAYLKQENATTVYLQIDPDVNQSYYKAFIEKATAVNIKIHALDGSSTWVAKNGTKKQDALFSWLANYQSKANAAQKFSAVHLDVEPYLYSEWSTNQAKTIKAYQDLVVRAVNSGAKLNLPVSFDIPFWFDEVTYKNTYGNGFLAQWVIDQTSIVTIMAYRNTAEAIIQIAQTEIDYATKVNKKVVIGVETLQSSEGEQVSFYTKNRAFMNDALATVSSTLNASSGFGGIAIHYYNSWKELQ